MFELEAYTTHERRLAAEARAREAAHRAEEVDNTVALVGILALIGLVCWGAKKLGE